MITRIKEAEFQKPPCTLAVKSKWHILSIPIPCFSQEKCTSEDAFTAKDDARDHPIAFVRGLLFRASTSKDEYVEITEESASMDMAAARQSCQKTHSPLNNNSVIEVSAAFPYEDNLPLQLWTNKTQKYTFSILDKNNASRCSSIQTCKDHHIKTIFRRPDPLDRFLLQDSTRVESLKRPNQKNVLKASRAVNFGVIIPTGIIETYYHQREPSARTFLPLSTARRRVPRTAPAFQNTTNGPKPPTKTTRWSAPTVLVNEAQEEVWLTISSSSIDDLLRHNDTCSYHDMNSLLQIAWGSPKKSQLNSLQVSHQRRLQHQTLIAPLSIDTTMGGYQEVISAESQTLSLPLTTTTCGSPFAILVVSIIFVFWVDSHCFRKNGKNKITEKKEAMSIPEVKKKTHASTRKQVQSESEFSRSPVIHESEAYIVDETLFLLALEEIQLLLALSKIHTETQITDSRPVLCSRVVQQWAPLLPLPIANHKSSSHALARKVARLAALDNSDDLLLDRIVKWMAPVLVSLQEPPLHTTLTSMIHDLHTIMQVKYSLPSSTLVILLPFILADATIDDVLCKWRLCRLVSSIGLDPDSSRK